MIEKIIHNTFHSSLLGPFIPDTFQQTAPPQTTIELADGSIEYKIKKIVG